MENFANPKPEVKIVSNKISVRVRAKVAELPNKIKRFELKQSQNMLYNSFSDWAGTMYTLIGLRMKAEDIGTIKRSEHKSSFARTNRTNENNESPEATNHSNISVQFIQSGTEFSIHAAVQSSRSKQGKYICRGSQGFYSWIFNYISG